MDIDSPTQVDLPSNKIKVQVVYDNNCGTWNAMTMERKCLFYGTVLELEQWLVDNNETHEEVV